MRSESGAGASGRRRVLPEGPAAAGPPEPAAAPRARPRPPPRLPVRRKLSYSASIVKQLEEVRIQLLEDRMMEDLPDLVALYRHRSGSHLFLDIKVSTAKAQFP